MLFLSLKFHIYVSNKQVVVTVAVCFWICANISNGASLSPIDHDVIDLIPSNPIRAFPCPEFSWVFSEPCVHNDMVILLSPFH